MCNEIMLQLTIDLKGNLIELKPQKYVHHVYGSFDSHLMAQFLRFNQK